MGGVRNFWVGGRWLRLFSTLDAPATASAEPGDQQVDPLDSREIAEHGVVGKDRRRHGSLAFALGQLCPQIVGGHPHQRSHGPQRDVPLAVGGLRDRKSVV